MGKIIFANFSFLCLQIFFVADVFCQQISIIEDGYFSIKKDTSVVLGLFENAILDNDGDLFLCTENSIYKYDKYGNLNSLHNAYGRGPGEFQIVNSCTIMGKKLIVNDNQKRELIIFDKDSLKYLNGKTFKKNRIRSLVASDSTFYSLNQSSFGYRTNALSEFDINLNEEKILNSPVPEFAYVGSTRNGGGITISNNGNIYFGFIVSPVIWKFDTHSSKLFQFEVLTDDHKVLDPKIVSSFGNDHMKHIPYTFSISRMMGLFFVEPNLILRVTEHGNPWKDEQVKLVADFINDTGELITTLEIPNRIKFAFGNHIYIERDSKEILNAYDNAPHGNLVQIFNKYKIIVH